MYHDEHHSPSGVMLSPKASFILGIVGGVLVLCTIGFFILLSMVLRGGVELGGFKNQPSALAPAPSPSAVPEGKVGEVAPVTKDDHVRGSAKAGVTLIEYSDFECPFCGRFHPSMVQLMNEYEGKVKWVYRHFPLSFHPSANPAANASECASEQGKFWEYADKLIENQSALSDAKYAEIAAGLGLNKSKFESCYSSKKYQARITADQAGGSTAGITGTPGTIIIGKDGSKQLVPGAVPYEQLKQMVEAAL